MADRNSAFIFGECFRRIARLLNTEMSPSLSSEKELRDFANWLWAKKRDYDFSEYQMNVDEALLILGFARWYEEKGEGFIIYKGDARWV